MKTQNIQKQKGFTLVEIAIVLVIIGLLLGGVLKGQELIENAKLKSVKADSDNIISAIYGYQDRFNALPGDDGASSTNVTGAAIATNGTVNNGVVEGNFNSVTALDESAELIDQLRRSGFISGGSGLAKPSSSYGGVIGVTSNAAGTSGLAVCQTGLSVEQMGIVDNKYDDGVANTGTVLAIADAAAALDAAYDASTFGICFIY